VGLHLLAVVLAPWLAAPLALVFGRRAGLAIAAITAVAQGLLVLGSSTEDAFRLGGIVLRVDGLDRLLAPTLLFGVLAACALGEPQSRAIAPAALLVDGAVMGVTLVDSPFLASLFLQLAGVAVLFVLPARTPLPVQLAREAVAGAKYLSLTVVSSLALLGAFALVETTRIVGEAQTVGQVVLALLLIGVALRVAAFPFQVWLPDFASIAPAAAVVLVSAVLNVTAVALLVASLASAPWLVQPERNRLLLAGLGALSALGGAFLALNARDLRRVVAYSSTAEVGFVLYGFGLGSSASVTAAFALLVASVVSTAMLWTVIANLERRIGVVELGATRGLIAQLPGLALGFLAASLTAGGLPLFAAFPGRWVLYRLSADLTPLLAVFLVAANACLLLALLRAFRTCFLGRPPAEVVKRESAGVMAALLGLAGLSLGLGLAPSVLWEPLQRAVLGLPFLR
jgi:multicomponent Na+:H+ antiporter subunit D